MWIWFAARCVFSPAPHLFTGHYQEIFGIGTPRLLRETAAKYGSVAKLFYGRTARIVVSDPDVIQRCNTTQFSTFHDRPVSLVAMRTSTGLLMVRGDAWKRDRNALLPAFNTAQLQSFMPVMESCIETFTDHLDKSINDSPTKHEALEINVMNLWASLTLEIFGCTSFGFSFGIIDKPPALQHPIVGAAVGMFDAFKPNPRSARYFQILATFPFLKPFRKYVSLTYTTYHADGASAHGRLIADGAAAAVCVV